MNPNLFQRSLHWLAGRLRPSTLILLGLLFLTLTAVTRGLVAVVVHLPGGDLLPLALLAVLSGWLLGRSHLNGWRSGLAGVGIGSAALMLTVGRVGGALLRALTSLLPGLMDRFACRLQTAVQPLPVCQALAFQPLKDGWKALATILMALATRTGSWFGGVFAGRTVSDPLISGLLWGFVLWLVSLWAAWWIARRSNAPLGLLPPLALLAGNVAYTNSSFGIIWLSSRSQYSMNRTYRYIKFLGNLSK